MSALRQTYPHLAPNSIIDSLTEHLTNAYQEILVEVFHQGIVDAKADTYDTACMSSPEWLMRACGYGDARTAPLGELMERVERLPGAMVEAVYQGLQPFEVVLT